MEQKEIEHTINVLKSAKQALLSKNSFELSRLSNQKIHTASSAQDIESITLIIILYTLSKIIERRDSLKIPKWDFFIKKFNLFLDLAIKALNENNEKKYQNYILKTKTSLESLPINLKRYVKEILKKASINKAFHIYEHGLSLGQTAKLLGLTQWELLEYTSLRTPDSSLPETLETKKRAQMALEFFA